MNVRHNRLRVRRKPAVSRFPLPPLLAVGMAAGYVIGCCFGANAALPEPSNPVLSFLSSSGAGGTLYGGLLPELCVGAIFSGAGACVLPAVGGCGRRVLCSTVFHTAYSVTCGHCG